jgi:hypothetical protein
LDARPDPDNDTGSSARRLVQAEKKGGASMEFRERLKQSSVADWLLLLFTAVIAGATIYQFIILGGQLDAMRKDQRPWVKVAFEIGTVTAQSPIIGVAHIVNGGKTPARDLRGEIVIERVKNGEEPTFGYPNPHSEFTTGTLFPNEAPANVPIQRVRYINNGPATEDDILTQTEFEDFRKTRVFFVIYGTVFYKDFFGIGHWTKQCAFFAPVDVPGQFTAQKCTNYSDIDNN